MSSVVITEDFEVSLKEFNITTLDKSTADILSPLIIAKLGQPQLTVFPVTDCNSLLQHLHLILMSMMQALSKLYLLKNKYLCLTLYQMLGMKSKDKVEEKEKDQDEVDKSEVLGNLVKVVVLIWSASLLTFSYVRLPNGQKFLILTPHLLHQYFLDHWLPLDSALLRQVEEMHKQRGQQKKHLRLFLLLNLNHSMQI